MQKVISVVALLVVVFAVFSSAANTKKVVQVELGGHCSLAAAPVGPGGSWVVVEKDVVKKCPEGSSCRNGACNCDNLKDGTVMSQVWIESTDQRVCRRIAGQKCSADNQCFPDVKCQSGICTCKTKEDCVDEKHDITILA